MNAQTNTALVQTWVAVADERGQTHLEARWVDVSHVPAHAVHAA